MNPAPSQITDNSQQKTENIPQVTPVVSTPSVIPPNIPSPVTDSTSPPLNASPQPFVANAPLDKPSTHHKFPFMMVTVFLVIVLAGFAGSFLFFSYTGNSSKKVPTQILITPPVSSIPTAIPTNAASNPFATPSSDLVNPFASPSASESNPFGTYQNPFQSASSSGSSDQPYQNPFEKLK